MSSIYAFSGLSPNATLDNSTIWAPETRKAVHDLEKTVFHMGEIDTDLLNRMVERGPSYLTAVSNYEPNVIQWNLNNSTKMAFPFVFVYPSEGTYWFDHPYCITSKGNWTTSDEQVAGAETFLSFITQKAQLEQMATYGIRPNDPTISLDTPNSKFSVDFGTDGRVTTSTFPNLPEPSATSMNEVIDMWYTEKKPVSCMLVIDTSGSMGVDKMNSAKAAAQNFIKQMQPDDFISLVTFSSNIVAHSAGLVSAMGAAIYNELGDLASDGDTVLYDVVAYSANVMNNMRATDMAAGVSNSYAVVLMTDGVDTQSTDSESQMFAALPDGTEADQLHYFTVGFGSDADTTLLGQIASQTNGKTFVADQDNVFSVYYQISMEF